MRIRRRLPLALASVVLGGLSACGGDGDPGTPAASAPAGVTTSETTSTTDALTPEEEVEAAYLRSWDVYAEAVRTLDPSRLEEVYAGQQLERTRAEVEDRKARGEPSQVSVEHDYVVQLIEPDLATVHDRYRNHSVLIDPDTGRPSEPDPDSTIYEIFTLKEVGGSWKVVDIVRQESSP
jgi:hypothetical protein